MQNRSTKFSAFVLTGFFLLQSSVAFAQSTIIVSPMRGAESKAAVDAISQELVKTNRVTVIEDRQVQKFIQKYSFSEKPTTSKEALEFFEQGKNAYQNLEMENALDFFRKAERLYKATLWDEDSFASYRTTKFYLSQTYLALGRMDEAKVELDEVLLLDPDRKEKKLSEKYYSPQVRALYAKVVEEFEQRDMGDVMVQTQPEGASVLFDGKKIGNTPVTIRNVVIGQHYFLLVKQGFQEVLQQQFVVKGQNRVQVTLTSQSGDEIAKFFDTVSSPEQMPNPRIKFLDDIGVALGGDIFLFLTPLPGKVQGQLFDQRSRELSPQITGNSPSDLVAQLMRFVGEDGYVIAQGQAPSTSTPLVVQDPTSSKPTQDIQYTPPKEPTMKDRSKLTQKKWFWPVVGAVVIGAGAGLYFGGVFDQAPVSSTLVTEIP